MAPYFDHMKQKTPHERRTHAMRVAGVVTALVFAGWITTIGLHSSLGGQPQVAASNDGGAAQTAAAVTAGADQSFGGTGTAQLVVATSTN